MAALSPRAVCTGEFEKLRRGGSHRGLVVLCSGESPGMGLLNAESFRTPYGAPAIHVASEVRDAVLAAAGQGALARLVAESRRTPTHAHNVVARLPDCGAAGSPLVVMTPRSSWWQSTAERGGVPCRLARKPARPGRRAASAPGGLYRHWRPRVWDISGSMRISILRRPGWEERASWVHWGANLGAAGGSLALVSPADDLRELGAAELARAGQPYVPAAKTLVPSGETRDIHKKGGRYLTLVGTNPLFHLPQDRWPEAVDLAAVTRIAIAASRTVALLARG